MKANEKYFAAIFGKPKSEKHWNEQRECPLKANMDLSACKKELENSLDDYTSDSNLFDFKNTRWKTDWEYKGMLFDLESDSEDPIFTVRPSLKRLHDKHVSWLINQAKSRFDSEEIARLMLKYKKNPKKHGIKPRKAKTRNFIRRNGERPAIIKEMGVTYHFGEGGFRSREDAIHAARLSNAKSYADHGVTYRVRTVREDDGDYALYFGPIADPKMMSFSDPDPQQPDEDVLAYHKAHNAVFNAPVQRRSTKRWR